MEGGRKERNKGERERRDGGKEVGMEKEGREGEIEV